MGRAKDRSESGRLFDEDRLDGLRTDRGAILLAGKFPDQIRAVAAISPAVWIAYTEARAANLGAYASAADFAAFLPSPIHQPLTDTPVRIASGNDDPFHAGVTALAAALPSSAAVVFPKGCHTGSFFVSQDPDHWRSWLTISHSDTPRSDARRIGAISRWQRTHGAASALPPPRSENGSGRLSTKQRAAVSYRR